MANNISTNGKKKLKTLKKEFNEKFTFLRLVVCPLSEKGKDAVTEFETDKTIAEARTTAESGEVSIHGKTKVKTLESDFEKLFGLYVEVGYTTTDGSRYFTEAKYNDFTLTALNEHGKNSGWKENAWD